MLATVSSTTLEGTLESLRIYEAMRQREAQLPPLPRLAGVHLEGPYFSQKERGAQDETIIRLPDAAEYERILEQAPCLRRWSIACELPGALNSVYTRSGQNSTPNSNATNLHSSQKRCCSFCISSSNASPTFQVQKSIFHQMTKPIQVTVILPLLLAISFSRNDDIHSSISGISNDLIGVIPTIGQ